MNETPTPKIEPKRLSDYQHLLEEKLPGARLEEYPSMGVYRLGFRMGITVSEEWLLDDKVAEQALSAAVERLQIEGIHQLGLEPRMKAWEEQVNQYRQRVADLETNLRRSREREAKLRAEIDLLVSGEEDDE